MNHLNIPFYLGFIFLMSFLHLLMLFLIFSRKVFLTTSRNFFIFLYKFNILIRFQLFCFFTGKFQRNQFVFFQFILSILINFRAFLISFCGLFHLRFRFKLNDVIFLSFLLCSLSGYTTFICRFSCSNIKHWPYMMHNERSHCRHCTTPSHNFSYSHKLDSFHC